MCIPVDSMLWALVARIRDEGYVATRDDFLALIGSGCPRARAHEVLAREGAQCPDARFVVAIATLEDVTG